MIGKLPESLNIDGKEYAVRTDYHSALKVCEAFSDEDLTITEKWIVAAFLLFKDFTCADDVMNAVEDGFKLDEAARQIGWYLSAGMSGEKDNEIPVYDWSQDEQMIFAAVNKIAGKEVRDASHMHWWTLSGYVNSVDKDDLWTFVVSIRNKLSKRIKLEKHEREFLNRNRDLVILKKIKTREEREQEEKYKALLDRML